MAKNCPVLGLLLLGQNRHRTTPAYHGRKPACFMPRGKSIAFARIRAEVVRLVALIPSGKFTTYGSIAIHMNVIARHVATVLARLTPEESSALPWHRVVSANARISPNMDPALARKQRRLLQAEGLRFDKDGYIQDADAHFHHVGVRRNIRWSEAAPPTKPDDE
jgi:methylated-DNA-protein-cysteine methyltransferase-like protein